MKKNDPIQSARMMGEIYKQAIQNFVDALDKRFTLAVDMLVKTKGHVVITGMGKSGLFGRKISSTFASTGTPSIFLHPAEAIHGDLGKVTQDDIVIAISSSGETEEIIRLLPAFKRLKIKLIAMTGDMDSTLAQHAETTLDIAVDREACPLNLAPTTSGLMTLAAGDALAIALMEKRGFNAEDFASTHPGGTLGKRLLSTVAEYMTKDNLPFVTSSAPMPEVIVKMTEGRLGLALVGTKEKLEGIITDGDLRRGLLEGIDIKTASAKDLMTKGALTISPDERMQEAEQRMQETRVQCLVVVDSKSVVVGVVQIF